MRKFLVGALVGAASAVVLVWAQIIAWGLMGQHYEDEELQAEL
jgi:hypothetical protein